MNNPNCFKATYLGDEVWFILDESFKPQSPQGAITYTLAEAQVLATRSEWTRKMVHEAKKATRHPPLPLTHQPSEPSLP